MCTCVIKQASTRLNQAYGSNTRQTREWIRKNVTARKISPHDFHASSTHGYTLAKVRWWTKDSHTQKNASRTWLLQFHLVCHRIGTRKWPVAHGYCKKIVLWPNQYYLVCDRISTFSRLSSTTKALAAARPKIGALLRIWNRHSQAIFAHLNTMATMDNVPDG